jgi:DNA-binding MarR family transcriptional regulator
MNPAKKLTIKSPDDLIVYNIGRLYVVLDTYLSRIYATCGLNPAKFNLLMLIKHIGKDSGISQMELGRDLYVSAANITKLLDGLERKAWITRAPSRKDRRVKLIKITQSGAALLDEVWVEHIAAINGLLESFSRKEKEEFHQFLGKFLIDAQGRLRT